MSTPNWNLLESSVPLDNPQSRPLVPPRATPLVSDRFTGGDAAELNGRTPDNGFGGTSGLAWVSNVANAFAIANGTLVRGSVLTSGRATLPVSNGNVEAGFTITGLPQSDGHSLFLDVRSNLAAGASGTRNAYRMQLTRTAGVHMVQLVKRAGAGTNLGNPKPVKLGDRAAIRVVGGGLLLLVNDYDVESYTDSSPVATGGHVGFESGGNAVFGIDDFYVEEILG